MKGKTRFFFFFREEKFFFQRVYILLPFLRIMRRHVPAFSKKIVRAILYYYYRYYENNVHYFFGNIILSIVQVLCGPLVLATVVRECAWKEGNFFFVIFRILGGKLQFFRKLLGKGKLYCESMIPRRSLISFEPVWFEYTNWREGNFLKALKSITDSYKDFNLSLILEIDCKRLQKLGLRPQLCMSNFKNQLHMY